MQKTNDFENVNNSVNIVDLVQRYVELKKVGKNYRGICPFHTETEPSFYVNPELNIAKCMGCGKGGAPVKFLSLVESIPPSLALKKLADEIGYKLTFNTYEKYFISQDKKNAIEKVQYFYKRILLQSKIGDEGLSYLQDRKLDKDIIEHFNLGFSPNDASILPKFLEKEKISLELCEELKLIKKGVNGYYDFLRYRITFPIYDKARNLIAFSGRTLKKDENIKYLNIENSQLFEKGKTLYNINNLEIGKPIYIVEGFFDVIAMYKAGINNAVSQMGTALTEDHAKTLKEFSKKIILCYDGDKAGFEAIIRNYQILLKNGFNVSVVLLNDIKKLDNKIDPDIFLNKYGKEKFLEYLAKNEKDIFSFLFSYYNDITNFEDNNQLTDFFKNIRHSFFYASNEVVSKYESILKEKLGYEVKLKQGYSKINNLEKIEENVKINKIEGAVSKEEKNLLEHILHQELSYRALSHYEDKDCPEYITDYRVNLIFGIMSKNKNIIYDEETKRIDLDNLLKLIICETDSNQEVLSLYKNAINMLNSSKIAVISFENIMQNAIKFKQQSLVLKKKKLREQLDLLDIEKDFEEIEKIKIKINKKTEEQRKLKEELERIVRAK